MYYERNDGYTLRSVYTNWGGANNGQLGDLNPFWVGTRLLCIETLVECTCSTF